MARTELTAGELLTEGWRISRQHLGLLVGLLLVYFLVLVGLEGINVWVAERGSLLQLVTLLLTAGGNGLLSLGLLGVSLKMRDGEPARFGDLFSYGHLLLSYVLGLFLYYLIVAVGLLLFIVPGLVWSIKYSFFPLFILDRRLGPVESVHASGRITQGVKWQLSWVWGVLMLVNLAGAMLLGFGLLLTVPITMIAYVEAYRRLLAPAQPPPLPRPGEGLLANP